MTMNVIESPSGSEPVNVTPKAVSSLVETLWPSAIGGSLVMVTEISTVAGADSRLPSFTVNVNESSPTYPALGV